LDCLEKIGTVNFEVLAAGKKTSEQLKIHDKSIKYSLSVVLKLNRIFNRKIVFAATSYFLIERAKRLYGLTDIKPFILPMPVEIPELDEKSFSEKPSVCFLARLDPQKRPWIFFELAKRFPDVDFLVAGLTNYPKLINPIIDKYKSIPNLKFLGMIHDREKDEVLKNSWALVNTSIHEGLPISFLESFVYGKPIISCQNPDGLVGRYGIYTGEILGDGEDKQTIDIFANALDKFLKNDEERIEKGRQARKFIEENYSYRKFAEVIDKITKEFNIKGNGK
jgi:glycosyltransferase involved in cell wall biosynthesis